MSEAISVSNNKKNLKIKPTKHLILVLAIAVVYTAILFVNNFLVAPFVDADIYTFFGAYVTTSLSGVLYGAARLYYRADSFAHFVPMLQAVIGALFVTMLLAQLFTLAGYMFLILPGLVLTVLFFFYPFVVVEEDKKNLQALKRSASLAGSVWFRLTVSIIGLYILFLFIGSGILLIIPDGFMFAEIVSATILFPLELYVYFRLYQSAIKEKNKKKQGGVKK